MLLTSPKQPTTNLQPTSSKLSKKNEELRTSSIYILGPARKLLSAGLYERADVYFHRGAARHRDEAFQSIFQKWKNQITPGLHAHAQGRETEEILPWLRLATKSDPHNIELYLVASHWLANDIKRPDLAATAIDEAIERNPDSYELMIEKGRLNLALNQIAEAENAISSALLLINQPQKDPEQAAIDFSMIYTALSYLHEALSHQQEAIRATEKFLSLKHTDHFEDRLNKLKSGHLDSEAATDKLNHLFHKEHQCDREDHEDHVHGPDCNH